MRLIARCAALCLLLVGSVAHGGWPTGGTYVMLTGDSQNGAHEARIVLSPAGDLLVVGVGKGGNALGYTLQRISAFGDIAPGWPVDGVQLGEVFSGYNSFKAQGYAVDDSLCFWHATVGFSNATNTPGAQLVNPAGVLLPGADQGWPAASGTGSTSYNGDGSAAAPAPGGAYVCWAGRVQRMTRAGTRAAGWPAGGVATGLSGFDTNCDADGEGGVIVMPAFVGPPAVQRIDSTGVRHAGWAAPGLVLSSDPSDGDIDPVPPSSGSLIRSDPTHWIAGWTGAGSSQYIKRVKLQRFSASGVLDPAWPAAGRLVAFPDTVLSATLVADGVGGVHVLWFAHGRIWGIHVRSNGTLFSTEGFGTDLSPETPYRLPETFLDNPLPCVVADAAPGGGLVYAWNEPYPSKTIHVRWLLPDLTPDPAEPDRVIEPTPPNGHYGRLLTARSDGIGGVYVAWEGIRPGTSGADVGEVWMTRLLPSSLAGVGPKAPGFAFSRPRPNPARGAFALELSLTGDGAARVELLDVSGRVVRARDVSGAGTHAVTFADVGSLAPGLYFARATSAAGSATRRIVLAR